MVHSESGSRVLMGDWSLTTAINRKPQLRGLNCTTYRL